MVRLGSKTLSIHDRPILKFYRQINDSSKQALQKASIDYAKANQPTFSLPPTDQEQFNDLHIVSTDLCSISNDPYTVPTDSHQILHDPYDGVNDPYGVSNDPYQASNDPYLTSDDPYGVSNDPYSLSSNAYNVINAGAERNLPKSPEKDKLAAPPYREFADGQGRLGETHHYSEQSREALVSGMTGDVKVIPGQGGPDSFPVPTTQDTTFPTSSESTLPSDFPVAKEKRRRPFSSLNSLVSFSSSSRARPQTESTLTVAERSASPALSSKSALTPDYIAEERLSLASRTLLDNIATQKDSMTPFKHPEAVCEGLEAGLGNKDAEGLEVDLRNLDDKLCPSLVRAAMNGSEEMVQELIQKHADLEVADTSK